MSALCLPDSRRACAALRKERQQKTAAAIVPRRDEAAAVFDRYQIGRTSDCVRLQIVPSRKIRNARPDRFPPEKRLHHRVGGFCFAAVRQIDRDAVQGDNGIQITLTMFSTVNRLICVCFPKKNRDCGLISGVTADLHIIAVACKQVIRQIPAHAADGVPIKNRNPHLVRAGQNLGKAVCGFPIASLQIVPHAHRIGS